VFENKLLTRIYGKNDRGENYIMINFIIFLISHNIIRNIMSKWMTKAGQVACMREMRNSYQTVFRKPLGKFRC